MQNITPAHGNPFEWLNLGNDISPTPISVPSWVPRSVANRIYLQFRGVVPVFERERIMALLNDSRLKDTFDEIWKQNKSGNGHPSIFFRQVLMDPEKLLERSREPFEWLSESLERHDAARLLSHAPNRPGVTDWNEIQQLGADYLFLKLDEYSNGIDRPATATATEVAEREREVLRVKKPLAEAALMLRSRGLTEEAGWVDKAARHWEIEIYSDWGNGIVELSRPSKKHPMEVRGCVMYFANVMNDLFGINMPSIIAKLVGLATEISISKGTVENILKDHGRMNVDRTSAPDQ